MKNLSIFLCSLLLVSCGGGSATNDNSVNRDTSQTQEDQIVFDVTESGGQAELPGVALVVFPAQSFGRMVSATVMSIEMNESDMNSYEVSGAMLDAGPSLNKLIKIHVPIQPMGDVLIDYFIPNSFLDGLGTDFRPRLFVKYFEEGADDEKLDTFEPYSSSLSNGIISASLPPAAFTNMRAETGGVFEAIIVLGCIWKGK